MSLWQVTCWDPQRLVQRCDQWGRQVLLIFATCQGRTDWSTTVLHQEPFYWGRPYRGPCYELPGGGGGGRGPLQSALTVSRGRWCLKEPFLFGVLCSLQHSSFMNRGLNPQGYNPEHPGQYPVKPVLAEELSVKCLLGCLTREIGRRRGRSCGQVGTESSEGQVCRWWPCKVGCLTTEGSYQKRQEAQGLTWCVEHRDTNSPGGDINGPKWSMLSTQLIFKISQY